MVIEQYWALHDYGQKCVHHLHEQLYSVRPTMQPLELQKRQCSESCLKIREFIDWVLCLYHLAAFLYFCYQFMLWSESVEYSLLLDNT